VRDPFPAQISSKNGGWSNLGITSSNLKNLPSACVHFDLGLEVRLGYIQFCVNHLEQWQRKFLDSATGPEQLESSRKRRTFFFNQFDNARQKY